MHEQYRTLGAMLALGEFTAEEVADLAAVKRASVHTVLNRHRAWIARIGQQPTGRRGGQFVRYRLRPEAVAVVEELVRGVAPAAPAAAGPAARPRGPAPPRPGGVEVAVIMVTDLVGSTALGSRLTEAAFEEFRRDHDSILRDAAEDLGGQVVKNTGDGFLFAFPSLTAALDAAVRMQQRLERRNRRAEVAMSVRIAVSVGDAAVEDGDYFGVPPIEATRLCAEAAGGEILVSDTVRAVLRGGGPHRLTPAGVFTLKGLSDPVAACRVDWSPLPDPRGPALPPGLRLGATAYVGRAAERETLTARWNLAAAGQRQLVVIAGEPGIGKTRLVTEAALGLPEDTLILYGRCDEDQGMPYYPWREVLRDYVALAPRRLLRPHASELGRLVPGLGEKLGGVAVAPSSDPDTERFLLFNAVQALLADAAELAPVLVILDDLHWADRSTLLLLKHLVTAAPTGRLMLVGTYRDSDVATGDPLTSILADLRREPGVTRIALDGLGEEDIVDLIEEMAGHPIDSVGVALAREVHRETAGNPFYGVELLRHLRETGVIDEAGDGRWSFRGSSVGPALPQSVREVIDGRVRRLGEEARRLLSVGAVIGRDFDLALVARAADRPVELVLDLLDDAVAAALLTRTPVTRASLIGAGLVEVYAFSHGLVHATLYDALPPGRRAALHQTVGEAIEASWGETIDARLAELAHHYLAAAAGGVAAGVGASGGDGGVARAVDYATRAGDQAMRQFAYDQAATLFARAVAMFGSDSGAPRIALLQRLGHAQMRAGDVDAARETLLEAVDLARRHDEPEALADAVRSWALWGLRLGVDEVVVNLAEEAIARLWERGRPGAIAELKGLLAAALYYAPISETERRERLAREALAGARAEHELVGDRRSAATLAFVISRYLLARWSPDSATRDFALADELSRLCRQLGDVELELLACNWRTTMLLELGQFAALDREVARLEQLAEDLRQPRATVILAQHHGILAGTAGRFAEAERLSAESLAIGRRIAGSVSRLAAFSQMMLIRLQQGRLPELEDEVRWMADRYPYIPSIRCALVVLLLQADRPAQARAELERIVAPGLDALPRNHAHILCLGLLAEAVTELGDAGRSQALYERLAPYAGRWVSVASTSALWPVDRSLARLAAAGGALPLAQRHLAAARRAVEQAGARPGLALLALDEARLLAPLDAPAARRLAETARERADGLGMRGVARLAARLIDELSAADDVSAA